MPYFDLTVVMLVGALVLTWLMFVVLWVRCHRLLSAYQEKIEHLQMNVRAIQATTAGMGKHLHRIKEQPAVPTKNGFLGKAEQHLMQALAHAKMSSSAS